MLLFFNLCSLSRESGLPINHIVPWSVMSRVHSAEEQYTNEHNPAQHFYVTFSLKLQSGNDST